VLFPTQENPDIPGWSSARIYDPIVTRYQLRPDSKNAPHSPICSPNSAPGPSRPCAPAGRHVTWPHTSSSAIGDPTAAARARSSNRWGRTPIGSATRPKTPAPWETLVEQVRLATPALSLAGIGPLDRMTKHEPEFFVHHEERPPGANRTGPPAAARTERPGASPSRRQIAFSAKFSRSADSRLRSPSTWPGTPNRWSSRGRRGRLTVTGDPGEMTLFPDGPAGRTPTTTLTGPGCPWTRPALVHGPPGGLTRRPVPPAGLRDLGGLPADPAARVVQTAGTETRARAAAGRSTSTRRPGWGVVSAVIVPWCRRSSFGATIGRAESGPAPGPGRGRCQGPGEPVEGSALPESSAGNAGAVVRVTIRRNDIGVPALDDRDLGPGPTACRTAFRDQVCPGRGGARPRSPSAQEPGRRAAGGMTPDPARLP